LVSLLEELKVSTTAVTTLLELGLVLNDDGLLGDSDRLGEGSRNGVVSSFGLCDETLVASNDWR